MSENANGNSNDKSKNAQDNDQPVNIIEPNTEKHRQVDGEVQAEEGKMETQPTAQRHAGNAVETDEIFTASNATVKPLVPSDIEQRYLRVGDKFYHPKNTSLVAFEDKGNKLETKSSSEGIAESLVRIAEARGWDEIKVSGTETFRKEVWMEATLRGMHVKGYSPSELDKAELVKRARELEKNKVDASNQRYPASENAKREAAESVAPVLLDFGAAKYLHDKKNKESYFVTTGDDLGNKKTSWGVDFERALTESGANIGDRVIITGGKPKEVAVTAPVHDKSGTVVSHEEKRVMRNAWHVEMAEAFSRKNLVEAIKLYPELAGAVATGTAMEKKAEADGLNNEQRAIVKARIYQNVTNSIERGDIPKMNIKENIQVIRQRESEMEVAR